ncbi:hypothetical protein ACXGQW_00670 [Wenyingzhuangia sp. IMCC45533]
MKSKFIKLFILVGLLISCKTEKKKTSNLPESEFSEFSNQLINEINLYNYQFVRTSWNKDNFKKRISKLSNTERTVLNAYFESFFNEKVINYSLEYIEVIEKLNGKIYLADTEIEGNTAILSLVSTYDNNIDFCKFRIEKIKSKIWITDILSLKDNIWVSEKLKNLMNLNSKYIASNRNGNRYKANTYYNYSNSELKSGNYREAFNYLDKVPESHTRTFEHSNKKLQIASNISEDLYIKTLLEEYRRQNYLYLEYLKSYYTNDSTGFNKVLIKLNSKINLEKLPDSIFKEDQFWN